MISYSTKLLLAVKNVRNERHISKNIYSPSGKFAEQAKIFVGQSLGTLGQVPPPTTRPHKKPGPWLHFFDTFGLAVLGRHTKLLCEILMSLSLERKQCHIGIDLVVKH